MGVMCILWVVGLYFMLAGAVSTSCVLIFTKSLVPYGVFAFGAVLMLSNVVGLVTSSWVGMIIFLVYIGGLMVMFAYFLAVCPNQLIEFRWVWTWAAGWWASFLGLYLSEEVGFSAWAISSQGIDKFFTNAGFSLLVLLAGTLFVTLVAVVKVVELNRGPLRPFVVRPKVRGRGGRRPVGWVGRRVLD